MDDPPTANRPGMVASASSLIAPPRPLPTLRSSWSLRVMRHSATASSLDAGSALSVRTTRVVTLSISSGETDAARQNAASTSSALASMSSPVRATLRSVRNPPSSFMATLRVAGGGSPWAPDTSTRSTSTCSSATVSNRAVTSGPR